MKKGRIAYMCILFCGAANGVGAQAAEIDGSSEEQEAVISENGDSADNHTDTEQSPGPDEGEEESQEREVATQTTEYSDDTPEQGSETSASSESNAQSSSDNVAVSEDIYVTKKAGPRVLMLLVGPSFGFGFFKPDDVNEYMANWQSTQGMVSQQSGTSDMFLNMVPGIAIDFAPVEYVQIQAIGEVGWGPKIVTIVNGDSETFNFLRFSVGGTLCGHLPIRSGRNSIYLGGGVLYHWMKFEEYDVGTPGYRGVAGFRFYDETFTPEIFLLFDYIKADTKEPMNVGKITHADGSHSMGVGEGTMELDYTGVVVGANFYFKLTG